MSRSLAAIVISVVRFGSTAALNADYALANHQYWVIAGAAQINHYSAVYPS
jgi:hypothetical protein